MQQKLHDLEQHLNSIDPNRQGVVIINGSTCVYTYQKDGHSYYAPLFRFFTVEEFITHSDKFITMGDIQ